MQPRQSLIHTEGEKNRLRFLAALQGSMVDAVISIDKRFTILSWNKAAEKLYGFKEKEALGKDIGKLLHTRYIKTTREKAFSQVKEKGVWRGELIRTKKNNKKILVQASISPLYDAYSDIVGYVGVTRDVTLQIEEALRRSQQNFRFLTETIPQIVWKAFPDGSIDFVNDHWYESTGQGQRDATGWGFLTVLHKEDVALVKRAWRRAIKTERDLTVEYRLLMRDGSYRWHLARGVAIKDERGKVLQWFGTSTNIDMQKKTEEQLKESEMRFRTLAQNAPDIISRHNRKRHFLYVNPAIEKVFGQPAKKYIGKDLRKTDLPNELCDIFATRISYVYRSWRATSAEYSYDDEGEEKYFQSRFVPEFDSQNRLTSVLVISHDITQIKQLQKKKDEFMSMASHELKTPLTSAKVFLKLLSDITKNESRSQQYLFRLDEQMDRLTRLVSDLLDMSKIQAGKLKLQKEYFSLQQLVEDTADLMEMTQNHHRIQVIGALSKKVYADRDRIYQVLINLLTNAIKYSPHAEKVEVRLEKGVNDVTVSVRDFGLGIAKKYQEKIFDQFFRDQRFSDRTFPGLGMGLYISHEIIKRHEGKIWVESKRGEGSTFYFSLPVRSALKLSHTQDDTWQSEQESTS